MDAAILTKKVGPLPVGMWALIVGGGGVAWWLMRRNNAPDTETTVREVPVPVGALASGDQAPLVMSPVVNVDMGAYDKYLADQAAQNGSTGAAATTPPPAAGTATGANAGTAAATTINAPSAAVLSRGSKGAAVRELQRVLNAWYPRHEQLVLDGNFGPKTEAFVRYFQGRAGFPQTGVADAQTLARLNIR